MAVDAATSTGAAEHSCATPDCEVPAAAASGAARSTPTGVGAVKLGRTYTSLRSAGFLSKLVPGCELGGPQTRAATLSAPLKGFVQLTLRSPRRVATILVRGARPPAASASAPPRPRSARRFRAPDSTIAAMRSSA